MSLSGVSHGTYPRSVLWRLRIGEGSTMLCSKLCGILTVQSPLDRVEEKISITLAVRTGSSSSLLASTQHEENSASTGALGLPPLAVVPASTQIPAWVRKTSRLKMQWIELSQASTSRQTQQSIVKGNDGITLDIGTAQRALQAATRDRSLMESMFRIAGPKLQSVDVGCTFSETPLSARGTSRFSSSRSLTDAADQFSASRNGSVRGGDSTPRVSSPPRSTAGTRGGRALSPSPSDTVPACNVSVSSQPPVYQKPFWMGFVVGCAFGATGVLMMLGQSGQLQTIFGPQWQNCVHLLRNAGAKVLQISGDVQVHAKKLWEVIPTTVALQERARKISTTVASAFPSAK
jgi:hypothetical protein